MKLLFIFTGGTIGSTETGDGYIGISNDSTYLLLNKYKDRYGIDFEYDTTNPYTILSENLCAENINHMVTCLKEELSKNVYDGIILTHGTDTLQFSAAALEYYLGDCNIPVILVSSNYVLNDDRANGISNLRSAILYIKSKGPAGIFVSYRNKKGLPLIHRGTLILSHAQYSDDVKSVSDLYHGSISDGVFSPNQKSQAEVEYNPIAKDTPLVDNSHILFINTMPGAYYPDNLNNVKAILVDTYHSGTINAVDENFSKLCKLAKENNIPVFLTGVEDRTAYASTKCFTDYNLVVLPKASVVAMYIKLWILLSINEKDIIGNMQKPIAYEFLATQGTTQV